MADREIRIDALRGLALVLIYWVHGMVLVGARFLPLLATPATLAFCDASEMFVFLAGVVFGRVYTPICQWRWSMAQLRSLRRAGEVWLAQMGLFAATLGVSGLVGREARWPGALVLYVKRPLDFVAGVPLLQVQAMGLDVLVLYITLLAVGPIWLWGAQRRPLVAIGASVLLWGYVQVSGGTGATQGFDPLAWQLIFFAGASLSLSSWSSVIGRMTTRTRSVLDGIAVFMVFWGILGKTLWLVLRYPPPVEDPLDWSRARAAAANGVIPGTFKPTLGPLRLLQFASAAWLVVRRLPADHRIWSGRFSQGLALMGRHSLPIYCATVVMDYALALPLQRHRDEPALIALAFAVLIPLLYVFARVVEALDAARYARPPRPTV